ncbi:MAG: peptidase C11 [Clostridiales bacterium]|nr:peptidase C11 [Candidatus Cacconaster stercorequi]
MDNRPSGHGKNISGSGKGIYKRGDGLHTGSVGNAGGYAGRGEAQSGGGKRSGGGKSLIGIILAAILVLGGGGAGVGSLLSGNDVGSPAESSYIEHYQSGSQSTDLSSLLGGFTGSGSVSNGWQSTSNVGKLNTSVASGARSKYTAIKGNNRDTVTIMVYMCGTDLESRSGMATSDLQEMLSADLGSKINLLVFTGGCKQWRNNVISSSVNQIYKVEDSGLRCLVKDAGTSAMTDPNNLASFIQWCAKNYPANRNELIFWDHGGGSLSGYGYDEKNTRSGSMTLQGIDKALKKGKVTFDFIGFDACLMATLENALTLTPYADYLIASEETEPGVGWYYTNWLTALGKNTSLSTLEIGKNIADDFVSVCAQKCRGQATTLSVVDLAELEKTAPSKLKSFAKATTAQLQDNCYQQVSKARSNTREFAASNKIDQVDLVNLADNLNTDASKALAKTLLSAVKYNKTSSGMTNAYGLSIYFPYQKTSNVDNAVAAYQAIGMDSEYARCIQQFASMEVSGQAVSGGASSPLAALMGGMSSGSSDMSSQMIAQVLNGLLGGNMGGVSGLTGSNSGFLGKSLNVDDTAEYLMENRFDANALVWTEANGTTQMRLSEDQWGLVQDLALNVFFDDGEGYIDMGLDNVYQFTDDGALVGDFDYTWIAINDQPVAYYHTNTVCNGDECTITGYVPAMVNGQRAEILVVFDNEHPNGYVAGARSVYHDGETETVAKAVTALEDGDTIDFLCDYYSYHGDYQDSYYLGDQMTVDGELTVSYVYIDKDASSAAYRFTDLYNQQYWTPVMP